MSNLNSVFRTDFESFMRKCFRILNPGQKLGNDPYLSHLCYMAEQIANGNERRVVVNLPPGHLKTLLFSIAMVAWILARDPTKRIIVVTNAQPLAEQITFAIREIMRSAWFRELCETRLLSDRASVGDFMTNRGGRVFATSVDGRFTGQRADVIIADDLLDIGEARDDAQVESVNNKFDTKIASRLNNPKQGTMVIVAHRLHDNDLSAHVMKQKGWTRVALELVAEHKRTYPTNAGKFVRHVGDLLRPGLFSRAEVQRLRETPTVPEFRLLYQQGKGANSKFRIRGEDFPRFDQQTLASFPVVISIDTAQKPAPGSSRHAIQVWKTDGHDHYLVEAMSLVCSYGELRGIVIRLQRKFSSSMILVEETSNGSALISDLQDRGEDVFPVPLPRKGKRDRLAVHFRTIKKKRIHLRRGADWVGDWLTELLAFPDAGDDQVDALTQFLDFMATTPELKRYPASDKLRLAVSLGSQPQRPTEVRGSVLVRSPSIFRPNGQKDWI
jgi:predicted phage terminase large subunit-like protein